jgi:preprotein translocase subunit SecE
LAGSSSLSTRAEIKKHKASLKTESMAKLKTYLAESWDEIKNKVTWSKYSELQGSAILVLVASTIFALVIGAIDWVFKTGLQWFYREF